MFCVSCGREIKESCVCISSMDDMRMCRKIQIAVLMNVMGLIPLLVYIKMGEEFYLSHLIQIGAAVLLVFMISLMILQYIHKSKHSYLAMFFNCHQRTTRSFKFIDTYMPVCARCTGIIVGVFLGLFIQVKVSIMPFLFILMIPMIIDGFVQLKTKYVSTNRKRIVTGILFGLPMNAFYAGIYFGIIKIVLFFL